MTHFASYEPENTGVDYVTMACGVYTHIENYSSTPECPECKPAARAHRAGLLREKLTRLRGCK